MTEVSNATRFLHAIEMGLGAWQWGDRVIWGYGQGYTDKEIREAFDASLNLGIRFVDTAEIYGPFQNEELVGSPHNIVRHPDMPKGVFADLWRDLRAGQMWQGYVKNCSKTGRFYWVLAAVFPHYRDDQIIGYISVRVRPNAAALPRVIEAYRKREHAAQRQVAMGRLEAVGAC